MNGFIVFNDNRRWGKCGRKYGGEQCGGWREGTTISALLMLLDFSQKCVQSTNSVPNGYPNWTRYLVFFAIPNPAPFSILNTLGIAPHFGKLAVSGIPRNYWVLGSPQYMLEKNLLFGSLRSKNRWYIQYTLKHPAIPRNTWKYPWVKKTPENNRSYFSKLLPDPNRTCFPVACIFPNAQTDMTFKDLLGTLWVYSNILISATPLEYFAINNYQQFFSMSDRLMFLSWIFIVHCGGQWVIILILGMCMISKLWGTRNNQLELSVHHRASVPQGSECGSSRSSQFQCTYR